MGLQRQIPRQAITYLFPVEKRDEALALLNRTFRDVMFTTSLDENSNDGKIIITLTDSYIYNYTVLDFIEQLGGHKLT